MKGLTCILGILFLFTGNPVFAQVPPQSGDRQGIEVPSDYNVVPERAESGSSIGTFLKDGKYGLQKNGSIVIPAVYDKVEFMRGELVQLKQANKKGVANSSGEILLPIVYDSIIGYNGNSILLLKNGKWGSSDLKGKMILPLLYDSIIYSGGENNYSYVVQNKQRFLLYADKIIADSLTSIGIYDNAIIAKKAGKFGILQKGIVTVPFLYDSIYLTGVSGSAQMRSRGFWIYWSHANVFITLLNNKFGLIKSDGTVAFNADNNKVTYDNLRHIFIVTKDSLQAIYFENSHKQTALEYSSIYTDGAQYINIKKKGKYGIIDYAANTILPFEYDKIEITGFNTGFRVRENGKVGWFKSNGEMLIPIIYDGLDDFFESNFKGLYKIEINRKFGVINAAGKIIVPARFEYIGEAGNFLWGSNEHDSSGLYNIDGREICKPEYRGFKKSLTEKSNLVFSFKDSLKGIIDGGGTILYLPVLKKTGYLTNPDGLLNPLSANKYRYLYLKDKNNKYGVIEETSGKTVIPIVYSDIFQKLETDSATFFAVRKGNKYGLISGSNRVVIPFEYDSINLQLSEVLRDDAVPQFVVKKGKLFGAVTINNTVAIPFEYTSLVKLDRENRYKARKGNNAYQLINGKNEVISRLAFDDIAQFENGRALSFYQGMMSVIDKNGRYQTSSVPMQPHSGYQTFEEMKWALIDALNSPDNEALKVLAHKAAPSDHILYFLNTNMFDQTRLPNIIPEDVEEIYYQSLLRFKQQYWNSRFYRKESLTRIDDYTLYDQRGYVTNKRTEDHAFGDTRFLEKFLRNAIKINGYWISSYFMYRNFNRVN